MNLDDFLGELNLRGRMLSITLTDEIGAQREAGPSGCLLSHLNEALAGGTVTFSAETQGCPGARAGFGFDDGLPEVKGGFGAFLTCGRGEGFPPGERIKDSAATAEAMIAAQPKDVLGGRRYICVKPYEAGDDATLVTWLVNSDQLSALIHLFAYRTAAYDRVIAPMAAGCATLFRIPLGEARTGNPRGVIGNVDIFSRPHFPADTFFFTVPHAACLEMLVDADESFLRSPIWRGVRARIHADDGRS